MLEALHLLAFIAEIGQTRLQKCIFLTQNVFRYHLPYLKGKICLKLINKTIS